jgi:hypothetical protein
MDADSARHKFDISEMVLSKNPLHSRLGCNGSGQLPQVCLWHMGVIARCIGE